MRVAQDIYDAYRIMPSLQLHQLRVAAVAQTICESRTKDVDAESVVLAALFHDMGNIIKSDFSIFPDFVEPEGAAHWQLVKDDFVARYGTDSHAANVAIARENKLPERVVQLIDGITFSGMAGIYKGEDEELKILEYADMRVGPHGVLTVTARVEEGMGRYFSKHPRGNRSEEEWELLMGALFSIESHLFDGLLISPDDITEQSIRPRFEALRTHSVPTA